MHNAAIAALGLDAVYIAARTTARAFPALVRSLLEDGGGLNVTMPLKADAARLVHWPSDPVRFSEACNTIWGDALEPEGDNTDIFAIQTVAATLMDGEPVGLVRIFGTGSSARSTALAVDAEWPDAAMHVVSRDPARAAALVEWAGAHGLHGATLTAPAGRRVDLAIAATPFDVLGDAYGADALGGGHGAPPRALLDLVYAPGGSPLVRAVNSPRKLDGRGVLVAQGAASFRHFFGVEPPVAVMREAVEDALGQ
jgi:shikimate dehydrogenase